MALCLNILESNIPVTAGKSLFNYWQSDYNQSERIKRLKASPKSCLIITLSWNWFDFSKQIPGTEPITLSPILCLVGLQNPGIDDLEDELKLPASKILVFDIF